MITEKVLNKVNKALKIKLYPWQRAYIKREPYDESELFKRRNGITTAYILRYLLEGGSTTKSALTNYADYPSSTTTKMYANWFINQTIDIDRKLKAAGVYDCAFKSGGKWTVLKKQAEIYKDNIFLLPAIVIVKNDMRYSKPTLAIEIHFAVFHAQIEFIKQ